MDLITIVIGLTVAFALIGLAASAFGADSRPTMPDDWRRAW